MNLPGTKIAEIFQTPGGTLVIRPRPGCEMQLGLAAVTRRQCDASFTLEPLGEWINIDEAARLMGIHVSSVLRIRDMVKEDGTPVLQFRRPSPFRVQVLLSSVIDHLRTTSENPEFWSHCTPAAKPVQS